MIDPRYVLWGENPCSIREIAAYGDRRAAEVGAENVCNFAIGNPSVEPPKCVHETMEHLLRTADPTFLHSYAPAAGLPEVREKLARYLTDTFGVRYAAGDVYLTCGASSALAILTRVLLQPGMEVVVPAPYFGEYKFYAESVGGVFVEVPAEPGTFQLDVEAMAAAVTERTAFVLLNSPNNPSGVVLEEGRLRALAVVLEEREREYGRPIYLLADEPYRELVYGGVRVPFLPAIYRDTIYCYSFSKTLSLPGDRMGFVALAAEVAEHDRLLSAIAGVTRAFGYLCVPPLTQLTVAACLGQTADLSVYEENRNFIYGALTELGYTCVRPDGAFYLFVKSPEPEAMAFCRRAMERDVMLVPGDDFGCPGYVRLAYCVPRESLERSVPRFRELAKEYGLQ